MAEKLSWSELRKVLSARAGVSEKTAGMFLNALAEQLIEGLRNDKQVKINGLGTFKLQAVAPRKSVNVSTGEEIVIEGYNKVVFSPEAGVKELVEKQPTAVSSQPSESDFPVDPIKKLGEQADEIVGLLADLGQEPGKEEDERTKEEPEPKPVVVVEEPVKEEKPQEPKKPKKYHFLRDLLICVVVLLLLLTGGYFLIRNKLSGWLESLLQPQPQQTEQVEEAAVEPAEQEKQKEPAPLASLIPEGEIPQQQILDEFMAISNDMEEDENERMKDEGSYSNLITTEEMHEGSRLTWMAKRFYGDKRFWPYLYDANRDRIVNPNNIEVGTPIRVPRLTAAQKDTTNAEAMAALEQLRIEAEAACRK